MGEVEYGYRSQAAGSPTKEAEYRSFLRMHFPYPMEVTKHTAEFYGRIKSAIFDRFAPKEKRTKVRRVEQLTDPATGDSLGVDENDVWIAAHAAELNFTLVTRDKMQRINDVIPAACPGLRVERW